VCLREAPVVVEPVHRCPFQIDQPAHWPTRRPRKLATNADAASLKRNRFGKFRSVERQGPAYASSRDGHGASGAELLVEEHAAANPHPVADQGVAVDVGAGELGGATGQRAGDISLGQPDGAGGGELVVEEHAAANPHPVADQGVAVAVGAGELGAAAPQRTVEIGVGQPDRAGGGEPLVEEHIAAHLQPVADQGVSVTVGPGELGTAKGQLAGNVGV
jgi:hypothetical protein